MAEGKVRFPGFLRWLARLLPVLGLILLVPSAAQADPEDIRAAARGVVRIVIVEQDGEQIVPVSHGTGFAVGPEMIVTNAHVVAEARADDNLSIGIVPSDGTTAVYARMVAVSPRNDLALLATTQPMRLPPLTISGNPATESGNVTAVGYPMNVDRAQGLSSADIFRAQPPVKSTGTLAGRRPTREFDSLLHTAPIARGSSGGPLLDDCGRVIGVNSFGAESGGADAEFFFAVSTRELLPFLRANNVTPQVNGMPCRSIADLELAERERAEQQRQVAQAEAATKEQALARRQAELRREIEFALFDERDNGLALAMTLLICALGAAGLAIHAHHVGLKHNAEIGFGLAAVAVVGAALAWIGRPGFDEIKGRLEERLRTEMAAEEKRGPMVAPTAGNMICSLVPERSRVTGAAEANVPFNWSADGCVNGRTQYGFSNGTWSRVLVPQDEESVSVNTFDPTSKEYRMERYLLDRETMERIRAARAEFQAPACGAGQDASSDYGAMQAGILALLPERPNERLVYSCAKAG
ncbi:trypsin-like peptidase domain-containing protein [Croceibacterium sp. LX-88]|uniref:Trypsin-like peptidase domain-containing protein n=1 Tax=Croceibacterium selenioxidans TaxID=2838833 RepID=A0ABS5W777_9SPHN|nr:serine protease [Croceibacterium selenioxidans]MBT2134244.1 trypsin-like peptidase domain-containing protein [Croceibacterium selenioxidans]